MPKKKHIKEQPKVEEPVAPEKPTKESVPEEPKVEEIEKTVEAIEPEQPKVEVDESFEPWTVDIRERCGDVVTKGDILTIQSELAAEGRKLTHLYVKDPQVESVKKVAKGIEVTVA